MPRHSNDPSYRRTENRNSNSRFEQEDAHPAFRLERGTRDSIEYLRAGGKTRPNGDDLENMSMPGAYRTYGHADDQDGDNDFDSSYGDKVENYDARAEGRFMRGEDEDSDAGFSPNDRKYAPDYNEDEDERFRLSSGYGNQWDDRRDRQEREAPYENERNARNRRRR